MNIKIIGIVGSGMMGSGIAQHLAQYHYQVVMHEPDKKIIDKALDNIYSNLLKLVRKGKISKHENDNTVKNIYGTDDINELKKCDIIIEAVNENIDIKNDVFQKLDDVCPSTTIFASNTSSLSITELAAATSRADRFLGLHFFNPVSKMPLVEVVKTITLDLKTLDTCLQFVKSIDKISIIAKDNAGFIVNYLLLSFMLNAISMFEDGKASINDIDNGMKFGCNHPVGPIMLADFIGLDTILYSANRMYDEFKSEKFAPPPILHKVVTMGYLGKKTKHGFYNWSDPNNPIVSEMFSGQ